jgi:deoxycytidine triphosphate deaminase
MILSNVEIQRALDEGRLIIRPEPSPRQPPANGVGECPYNTTSVDLRLGD